MKRTIAIVLFSFIAACPVFAGPYVLQSCGGCNPTAPTLIIGTPLAGEFSGGIGFNPTNTLDIGTNATTLAPRTIYAGTSVVAPIGTFTTGAAIGVGTATTLAIGGCTIGSDAFCTSDTATIGSLNLNSATVPVNGLYLSAANTISIATNTTFRLSFSSTGLSFANAQGAKIVAGAASATVPVFVPNQSASSTGFGAQAGGNISAIVAATEVGRWTSTGLSTFGDLTATGNFVSSTAAKTLVLKQGANGSVGTFVCTSGGSITVNNTNVAVTDAIIMSLNTVGGTPGGVFVSAITAGTSFVAKCASGDTSTYNYAIIKNAA